MGYPETPIETVRAIISDYRSGLSMHRVAERHGLSRAGVKKILLRAKVELRTFRRDLPLAELAERYEAGETFTDLARECGVDRTGLTRRLTKRGVESRGQFRLDLPTDDIAEKHRQGARTGTLAVQYGVAWKTIALRLSEAEAEKEPTAEELAWAAACYGYGAPLRWLSARQQLHVLLLREVLLHRGVQLRTEDRPYASTAVRPAPTAYAPVMRRSW